MLITSQFQQDVEELITNPSTICHAQMKHQEAFVNEVKETFSPTVPLILHWDGKIMEDYSGLASIKWSLLVLVSGQDVIKLLAVL